MKNQKPASSHTVKVWNREIGGINGEFEAGFVMYCNDNNKIIRTLDRNHRNKPNYCQQCGKKISHLDVEL